MKTEVQNRAPRQIGIVVTIITIINVKIIVTCNSLRNYTMPDTKLSALCALAHLTSKPSYEMGTISPKLYMRKLILPELEYLS